MDSLPALIPQWFEEKDGSFRRLSTSDPFYHVTYEGQLIVLDIKGQEDGKMFMAVSSNPVFPNESASVTYRLLVHKGTFGSTWPVFWVAVRYWCGLDGWMDGWMDG